MFSDKDFVVDDAHVVRIHNFVGFARLHYAVLMYARLVRESVSADDCLVHGDFQTDYA